MNSAHTGHHIQTDTITEHLRGHNHWTLTGGSAGVEDALPGLLDGLLRSPPVLRAAFIVLWCAHFFNCFQRLNCQFTVNLGGEYKGIFL